MSKNKEYDNFSEKDLNHILYKNYIQFRKNWDFITQINITLEGKEPERSLFVEISFISSMMIPWYIIYRVLKQLKLIEKHPPFKFWEYLNRYYESLRHPSHQQPEWDSSSEELYVMDVWFLEEIVPKLKFWHCFCSKEEEFLLKNVENKAYDLYQKWKNEKK